MDIAKKISSDGWKAAEEIINEEIISGRFEIDQHLKNSRYTTL